MRWTPLLLLALLGGCANDGPRKTPNAQEHAAGAPGAQPTPAASSAKPTPSRTPASSLATGAVFVGCGFLFADNEGHAPFTVFLGAEKAQQVPDEAGMAFVLDGVLVEAATTTAEEMGVPSARGTALLETHRGWEVDHLRRNENRRNLKVAGGGPADIGGAEAEAITWGLEFPAVIQLIDQKVNRLAYVTAAVDDAVLALMAPLRPEDDARAPVAKLESILRTIKRLPAPFDLNAVGAEVQASQKPWSGCPPKRKPN